jgi:[ribosomal protein S5]-alanine N-acetyltransferase
MNHLQIETPRLILRQWQASDYGPFIAMNLDSQVMRYFPSTQTREQTLALVERVNQHFAQHGYGVFAVERKDTGQFIGFTGLSVPRFESYFTPCVEIGWRLAKEHWNQGFAQEGARASLDFGFNKLGLKEIYSFTSIHNLPSINVMKKIGMKEDGHFEHPNVPDGNWLKAHVLYKIPA